MPYLNLYSHSSNCCFQVRTKTELTYHDLKVALEASIFQYLISSVSLQRSMRNTSMTVELLIEMICGFHLFRISIYRYHGFDTNYILHSKRYCYEF